MIPKTRLAIPKSVPDPSGMVATSYLRQLASLCRKRYHYDTDDDKSYSDEIIDNLGKDENDYSRHDTHNA